jgi:hypothetical protein
MPSGAAIVVNVFEGLKGCLIPVSRTILLPDRPTTYLVVKMQEQVADQDNRYWMIKAICQL